MPNQKYCLRGIKGDLLDQPIRVQFSKAFMIFAYATMLVPNTKHEGIRDIWDQICDGDLLVQRNWVDLA